MYMIKSLDKRSLTVVLIDAADEKAQPISINKNIILQKRFWPQKEAEVVENNPDVPGMF